MNLKANETILIGEWKSVAGKLVADDVCTRINDLIAHHLVKIAESDTGWEILYLDPLDGRLWELSYPESNLQGGGPPMLKCVPKGEAYSRYHCPDV